MVSVVVDLLVADDDGVGIVAVAFLHCVLSLGQAGEPAGVVAFLNVAFLYLAYDGLQLLVDFGHARLSQAQLVQPVLQLGQQVHYFLLEVVGLLRVEGLHALWV